MDNRFYVECDMQGNFLISDDEEPLFLIMRSEEEQKLICWRHQLKNKKPAYYYLTDRVYKLINNEVSIITHDTEYIKVIKQVCENTYPGTITLAYEDLTEETL